mgnify:CR=1 FL=1
MPKTSEVTDTLDYVGDIEVGNSWTYWTDSDDGEHVCEIVALRRYAPFNKPECLVLTTRVVHSDTLQEGATRDWFRTMPQSAREAQSSIPAKDIARFLATLAKQAGVNYDGDFRKAAVPTIEAVEAGEESEYVGTRIGIRASSKAMRSDPSRSFTNLSFYVV